MSAPLNRKARLASLSRIRQGKEAMPVGDPLRACGSCDACCTALAVNDGHVSTPQGEACGFLRGGGGGCGIYDSRPKLCRGFLCGWRVGLLGAEDRPDLSGVVVHYAKHGEVGALYANEVTPGANAAAFERLLELAERLGWVLVTVERGSAVGHFHGSPELVERAVNGLHPARRHLPLFDAKAALRAPR